MATEAGELVRSLNHATLQPGAYVYPGDVDDTVQALVILAARLPQAISQGGTAVAGMATAGNVRLDAMAGDASLTGHVAETASAVTGAVQAAAALESALRRLGSLTSRLAFAESRGSAA
ncbi:hypothetical protein VM98_26585 [Streptomyces rubellomurinus subsp. indigoferus]|nr:hypothetical protein VM98_26585 [Streptomyces rubellomurinus subsp. indigoferus]